MHTPIEIFLGDFELRASLKHIINDGLMVIFFFLLGLEIKREVLAGDLAQPETRRMLMFCAIGGMVCPAVIYSLLNWSLDSQVGWGIPMATDTAFALGFDTQPDQLHNAKTSILVASVLSAFLGVLSLVSG